MTGLSPELAAEAQNYYRAGVLDPGQDIDEVTGAELLDSLRTALLRYVVLPSVETADAVTLWVAASHAVPAWQHAPRLAVISPEKRCGKSRLLDVIEATCHVPLMTVNISSAALVRSVTADPPTLIIDEADTIFGRRGSDVHEDLRGILNAGHQPNRPYRRWNATTREMETCPTFSFAALAGIGDLPDTIMDRSVVVRMRRRSPAEKVEPYRIRDAGPLRELGGDIGAWLRDHVEELSAAFPDMPVEDRAADTWEPLVAVADLAGGHWPGDARRACIALTSDSAMPASAGVRLLADIHTVFGNEDKMHTAVLIAGLCKLDESPWADWKGRNITPRDIADLLKPYGVRSNADVKIDGTNRKGYYRRDLADAWARYLPEDPREGATEATGATAQVSDGGLVAGSLSHRLPATSEVPPTSTVAGVAPVADDPQVGDGDMDRAERSVISALGGTIMDVDTRRPSTRERMTAWSKPSPHWRSLITGPCPRCGEPTPCGWVEHSGKEVREEPTPCLDCAGATLVVR